MEPAYVPLPHLTATNCRLSAGEDASVRHRLQVMELRASSLRMELEKLENHISEYKLVLSPIRRVPYEILGEIFSVIPRTDKGDPLNYQDVLPTLSLVSKGWCQAARLRAHLWKNMCINARRTPLEHKSLGAWASRAGSLPKSLTINGDKCGERDNKEFLQSYLDELPVCSGGESCIFFNAAFREVLNNPPGVWRSLIIDCPTPDCFQRFGDMLALDSRSQSGSAPWTSMQSFTLISNSWGRWSSGAPRSLFHFLPTSITTLTLDLPLLFNYSEETDDWDSDLHIPQALLKGLITFRLTDHFASGHLFQLLPHCVNLETLSIDFADGPLDQWSSDPITQHAIEHGFTLPKLQVLRLMNGISFEGLESMRMPELLDLAMGATYQSSCKISQPYFATFIRGDLDSRSKLRHLAIKLIDFDGDALYDTLKDLSSLTHLILDQVTFHDDTFLKLSKPIACLPQLQVLKLIKIWAESIEKILHLREFVEARSVELNISLDPAYHLW